MLDGKTEMRSEKIGSAEEINVNGDLHAFVLENQRTSPLGTIFGGHPPHVVSRLLLW